MALLSVWGIVLVVLGHSGFEEQIVAERLSGLHGWIYGFHMPLFFFISGYLFAYTNPDFAKIDAASFLWKKVRRLIVPYVVLGAILFVVKWAFSSLSHADREFGVLSFFRMFVAPGAANSTMGYLWYVFTLFVVFAAVVGLSTVGIDLRKPGYTLAAVFSSWTLKLLLPEICLLNLSAVFWYLPFFVLGIGSHTYETRFSHPKSRILRGGKMSMLFLLTLLGTAGTENFFIRVIAAVAGIGFSVSICRLLLHASFVRDRLVPLSDRTYAVYLLSWFWQYAAKVAVFDMLHLHWTICVVAMFVVGIIGPLWVCRIVDRLPVLRNNRFLRLIIGY